MKGVVKLFVHFDLWSLTFDLWKWTKTDTKVTMTHPPTPPIKLFLVSYERYGQINTFLLRYNGTDFASIKRYGQFCFLLLYMRRHRFILVSAVSISALSLSFLCSLFAPDVSLLFSLNSSLSLPALFLLSLCSFPTLSLSVCSLYQLFFSALSLLYILLYSSEQSLTLKNVRSCYLFG